MKQTFTATIDIGYIHEEGSLVTIGAKTYNTVIEAIAAIQTDIKKRFPEREFNDVCYMYSIDAYEGNTHKGNCILLSASAIGVDISFSRVDSSGDFDVSRICIIPDYIYSSIDEAIEDWTMTDINSDEFGQVKKDFVKGYSITTVEGGFTVSLKSNA